MGHFPPPAGRMPYISDSTMNRRVAQRYAAQQGVQEFHLEDQTRARPALATLKYNPCLHDILAEFAIRFKRSLREELIEEGSTGEVLMDSFIF